MNKQLFRFTLFLLIYLILPLSATAQVVDIPDLNLRAAIEAALGKEAGAPITADEMATLTYFRRDNAGISDLSGLEFATNLTQLVLKHNSISDISPVAGLINLTQLHLPSNSISDISPVAGLINLTQLHLPSNSITDISPLTGLTNLTWLVLQHNSISDISPVAGLINLTHIDLQGNSITDISPVAGLTNLTELFLLENSISDISPVAGLINLTWLNLWDNSISDISPVAGLINLKHLELTENSITDISPVAGLINLPGLSLQGNSISDISPVAGLINLKYLWLTHNNISDISPVAELTNLTDLNLAGNSITDISPVAGLINLTWLNLWDNNISDILPLVANTGLGEGDEIRVGVNPLSYQSIRTHILALQNRGVTVKFSNLIPPMLESLLSIPSGISLIHIPLKVRTVDGVAKTIESIGDLYDAFGGANAVKLLLTLDSHTQEWFVYFGPPAKGTPADRELTDDMGILAQMNTPVSVRLTGSPLGTNGNSIITLNPGYNLVGVPLNDSRLTYVSDLFTLEGISGNAPVVIFTDNGEFKAVVPAGGPDDIPIIGSQAFILEAQRAAMVIIYGDGWTDIK